jgi:hypothetical protein
MSNRRGPGPNGGGPGSPGTAEALRVCEECDSSYQPFHPHQRFCEPCIGKWANIDAPDPDRASRALRGALSGAERRAKQRDQRRQQR